MKKIFMMLAIAFCLSLGFISCESCKKDKDTTPESEQSEVVVNSELNVEHVTAADKQYMFTNYGGDYRWFESCILLQDFLDEENDGTVAGVSNVFQVVNQDESGKSADVFVVLAAHTPDSTAYEVKKGFWVEDFPLNDEAITVTFKDAYDKIMATNMPKPHSRHVVLRKEVGPVDANPQYIFGNSEAQIYVDAVTGDVSETNPAFPEAKGFKMPLGEWP